MIVSLGGCGASATAAHGASTPGADAAGREAEAAALEERAEEQARRLAELETRVALLERESRSQRVADHVKPTGVIRIGASRGRPREEMQGVDADAGAAEPVETLRFTSTRSTEPWQPPTLPPGVPGTLPVVPLPEEARLPGAAPAPVAASAPAVAEASKAPEARAEYRAALRLLQGRRFGEASAAFGAWLGAYPEHALSDDAMYWQGEAHYGERRYREALERFEGVVGRFPDSARLPDALVKIGLCRRHLGDEAGARTYFRRVREQYPDSDAARLVPPEGAS